MERSVGDDFLQRQAESGAKLRAIAVVVILTPFALALAIPTFKALWTAVESIPADLYPVIGVVLIGGMVIIGLAAGGMAFWNWIARPGRQLPPQLSGIEDWAEGGD